MREKEVVSERGRSRDWMWMRRLELPEGIWEQMSARLQVQKLRL